MNKKKTKDTNMVGMLKPRKLLKRDEFQAEKMGQGSCVFSFNCKEYGMKRQVLVRWGRFSFSEAQPAAISLLMETISFRKGEESIAEIEIVKELQVGVLAARYTRLSRG